jgi:hypothetical protein
VGEVSRLGEAGEDPHHEVEEVEDGAVQAVQAGGVGVGVVEALQADEMVEEDLLDDADMDPREQIQAGREGA